MTRDEFKIIVKGMKAVYADTRFIADADAFEIWFKLLEDLDYKLCEAAVQKHMVSSEFPPTIASIRTNAMELMTADSQMSEGEAWGYVYKAICNSNYCAVEEYDKLPEQCKVAIGHPDNLRAWAMLEANEVSTVIQSQFLRSYRQAGERMKQNAKLPPVVREVAEKLAAPKREALPFEEE